MAFSPRYSVPSPGTYGYSWSDSEISSGVTGKHQCTWYAVGRGRELGADWQSLSGLGDAENFYDNFGGSKSKSNPQLGDIICFNGAVSPRTGSYVPGHVMVIESINGSSLTCSDFNGSGDESFGVRTVTAGEALFGRYDFEGYLHLGVGGGGGGGNPDDPPVDPPSPGQQGHWEWVEETIEIITTYSIPYTDMYECGGDNIWSGQSGTQDVPQAPTRISSSTSRMNQRWEPFNMYTDERTLTYTVDGQPVWSNWETKYTGSDSFMLGGQPTYGNGWEMEWQGDDD